MTDRPQKTPSASPRILWAVTATFILLALAFAFDLMGSIAPVQQNAPVDLRYVEKKTVRDPMLEAPLHEKAGFQYKCNSCHQHFGLSEKRGQRVAEHTDLVLQHGQNKRCLNCHNAQDMETFVDHDGSAIAWSESLQLCRKCHGPKYNDWVAGVHGRPNGYWDTGRGASFKAVCTACHDPHAPAFKPLAPAPGPRERRGAFPTEEILHLEQH